MSALDPTTERKLALHQRMLTMCGTAQKVLLVVLLIILIEMSLEILLEILIKALLRDLLKVPLEYS